MKPNPLRAASLCAGFAILLFAGCTEKQMSQGELTVECGPHISATGKEERLPHPTKVSECKYNVMMRCNACVYSPDGSLSHAVSETCGVCFTQSF